jgi:Na+-driven multidrug efflux pump
VRAARAWHALTALVALAALVLQLVLVVRGGRVLEEAHPPSMALRLLRFVAYFTVQSNVLVLVSEAALVRDPERRGAAFRVVRTAAMTGIIVTGLVHWFLLRPLLHLHGADLLADKLLHLAVPILAVVGWSVFGPRPMMTRETSTRATVWPLAWLLVTLGQGAVTGWYPYPFLDHREHGWDHVVVVCAGIFVLWFGLLAGQHAYDGRVRRAPRAEPAVTGS